MDMTVCWPRAAPGHAPSKMLIFLRFSSNLAQMCESSMLFLFRHLGRRVVVGIIILSHPPCISTRSISTSWIPTPARRRQSPSQQKRPPKPQRNRRTPFQTEAQTSPLHLGRQGRSLQVHSHLQTIALPLVDSPHPQLLVLLLLEALLFSL